MPAPLLRRQPLESSVPVALDPGQERVVDWRGPGTCAVLAAPGTGATTAIIEAVVARLSETTASRVLVIAPDRDAVRRMRSALARRAPSSALPTVTTFHGLAYALVRRTTGPGGDAVMPRLLSGAEEDARIRELLRGAIADGEVPWPADLRDAAATLGLANDLRSMLARARELGFGPRDLDAMAEDAGVPAWRALGRLAEMDSEVMALEGVIDYGGLLEMAVDAAHAWPGELAHVYVDDFQEAGLLQRRLLLALARPATATLVAADPDVAAFGFRGGDRLGVLRLIEESRAEVIVLDQVHAGAGGIRRAYDAVTRGPALPGLSAAHVRAYRHPRPAEASGSVEVVAHDSWGDLAAWVAHDLRRRHLGDGTLEPVAWSSMAVIGRSTSHLESMRRACAAAGVPVTMSVADRPLSEEPAVASLLAATAAAIAPEEMDVQSAVELMSGPMLGLDAAEIRSLARALRVDYRSTHPGEPAPPGLHLVRDCLASSIRDPDRDVGVGEPAQGTAARVATLGRMLAQVRACAEEGAAPAEVLWQAWVGAVPDDDGLPWAERLRRAALAGHGASSHDVDAVIALFATAERLSERYAGAVGIRGLLAALQGQRVAAERITAAAPSIPAVTLLTAHQAVGRRWDHVVIVGAQEGAWPPALGGSSALRLPEWEAMLAGSGGTDAATSLRAATSERMAQERRLFALALSRASRSLTVATVSSDAEQPSRFVEDLDVEIRHRPGRPPRPLTIDGMVARLRTIAQDPEQAPELRRAAVERLAALADAVDDQGAPLAPRADPRAWWGLVEPTPGLRPVRSPDQPVTLSGSGLATLRGCPLRWFLSRVVRAEGPRGRALAVGSLVHLMAERAARGEVPVDPEAMLAEIDRVWSELPFDAPWESLAERAEVGAALARLCAYLGSAPRAVAVEHEFAVSIPLVGAADDARGGRVDGGEAVVLRGAIDRIEISGDGRVRLVDFKTARTPPSASSVESDPQLGVYQLAVRHGALGDLVEEPEVSGAALVQLRADAGGRPRVQEQPPLGEGSDSWLLADIGEAMSRVRAEDFPATPSSQCRTCPYVIACPAQVAGREVLA